MGGPSAGPHARALPTLVASGAGPGGPLAGVGPDGYRVGRLLEACRRLLDDPRVAQEEGAEQVEQEGEEQVEQEEGEEQVEQEDWTKERSRKNEPTRVAGRSLDASAGPELSELSGGERKPVPIGVVLRMASRAR